MSKRLVESASKFLDGKVSRRGFLRRAAWVGTALVAAPATYMFRPVTAQAAVLPSQCGSNTPCNDGWTDFCINLPGHSGLEILELLKRTYNRQRQAQITQEIAEIVGGAAALQG